MAGLCAGVVLYAVWCLREQFVGRVSTRHVGLKPDLQGFTHKCIQERNTALGQINPLPVFSKREVNFPEITIYRLRRFQF